jgi:cystathionine beta-lyase
MPSRFDTRINRHHTGSIKWDLFGEDVLPLWVADMDFESPEPLLRALHRRVDHGVFGYQFGAPALAEVLAQRMETRYGWTIQPQDVIFLPNLVSALNFSCLAYAGPGEGVLMQTPVYPPFLSAPLNAGRQVVTSDLLVREQGNVLRYEIDFVAFEAAITPQTRAFILCNPHNPVGRVWTRSELQRMADICLRHNLTIISDEIHCDLLLDSVQHIPIASLSPEVAAITITLMAPSKTFNVPTLGLGFAIAQNKDLRDRFEKVTNGFLPHPGAMGFTAATAAYTECQAWLDELLPYLKENRDTVMDFVTENFPSQVRLTCPEGTYLMWLDLRGLNLPQAPSKFLLETAKVGLNDGADFGEAGKGFVRLNLGAPRSQLIEALERMQAAFAAL